MDALSWAGNGISKLVSFGASAAIDAVGQAALSLILLIAEMIFWAAGWFLTSMGILLDTSIRITIDSNLYSTLSVINVGWTTVRDFSNMFFIFALLYIAIKTILGLGGGNTKRWVANLIIAAVLINFSLFATKVVVDAGNILAMGFWNQMNITVTTGPGPTTTTGPSAASHLMQGLKVQSLKDLKKTDGTTVKISKEQDILLHLGGALVMLIAGYVFLAGAVMMVVRTVTLILLMILSPFAFLGFGLPVGGGFAQRWLDKLISNAFVAPAFLAMLYIVIRIINSPDLQALTGAQGATWGGVFAGDAGSMMIVFNYLMMIILLLACLTVANAVSSGAGSMGGTWAKRGLGYGAMGTAMGIGATGRQLGGRLGKRTTESKALQDMAKSSNRFVRLAGNLGLASGEKMKKGTWDPRNAGLNKALGLGGVNAGTGTKRSYATHGTVGGAVLGGYRGTEKEKQLIETAKDRYAGNPGVQRSYLTDRGVDLEAKRNKDVKTELARADVAQKHKDDFKKQKERLKELEENRKKGVITPENAEEIGKTIAEEMKKTLAGLTGKETADMLSKDDLKSPVVIASLQSKDLSALTAKGELSQDEADAIGREVVNNGTASARNYMKSQAKVAGQFSYDAEANLSALTKEYDDQKKVLGKDSAEFKEFAEKQRKEINKALGMAGGATEIKEMADSIIMHDAVVSEYNGKVARELSKKIAETSGADSALAKEFEAQLSTLNKQAQSAKATSEKAARDASAARSAPKGTVIVPPSGETPIPPLT